MDAKSGLYVDCHTGTQLFTSSHNPSLHPSGAAFVVSTHSPEDFAAAQNLFACDGMAKKHVQAVIKAYVGEIKKCVVAEATRDVDEFMQGCKALVKEIMGSFESTIWFSPQPGELSPSAMPVPLMYAPDGTPQFLFWRDGCEFVPLTRAPGFLRPDGIEIAFLTFHHLLYGKEHKKEKDMVDLAASTGFHGLIIYGQPGIIIVDGQPDEIQAYLGTCRKNIGKKGDVSLSTGNPQRLGDMNAVRKRGSRGLGTGTLETLRELLCSLDLGEESTYRQILGLKT